MQKIMIDGVEYDIETMSDICRSQLANINFVDAEILRLQNSIAVYQSARSLYVNVLQKEILSASDK